MEGSVEVYNLHVENENHCYFAGGILVHNGEKKEAAMGGHFEAGVPVKVGEQGPEIFVPDTAGNIIPHYGSMITTTNNFNLYVTSAVPASTVVQDFQTMKSLAGAQ